MSKLEELRQIHSEMVTAVERFGRVLAEAESAAARKAVVPSQIEYDRRQLDSPPRPVQPALESSEVFCKCGDRAKRIEKEGRNGKPYVAFACPNPKADGCDFWVFESQLQRA